MLAGRSLPLALSSAALFATWFGSETVFGASSEFLQGGLYAVIEDPFGAALCLVLFGLFITRKLYALSGHGVPNGLFRHFTNVARNWLLRLRNNPGGTSSGIGSDDDNRGQRSQQPTSVVETQHQNLHLHSRTSFYSPIPPTLHCWIRIKYSSSIFMVLQ